MNKENTANWPELYQSWQYSKWKYPRLDYPLQCQRISIEEPKYGPAYHYNWVERDTVESDVQRDVTLLSRWIEPGSQWSRGTVKTVELLTSCETEEELAAVWIAAFARSWIGPEERSHTISIIEDEARSVFVRRYGYWHYNSTDLFPGNFFPDSLIRECGELSASTIIELAAFYASLVMGRYVPVEYKKNDKANI